MPAYTAPSPLSDYGDLLVWRLTCVETYLCGHAASRRPGVTCGTCVDASAIRISIHPLEPPHPPPRPTQKNLFRCFCRQRMCAGKMFANTDSGANNCARLRRSFLHLVGRRAGEMAGEEYLRRQQAELTENKIVKVSGGALGPFAHVIKNSYKRAYS